MIESIYNELNSITLEQVEFYIEEGFTFKYKIKDYVEFFDYTITNYDYVSDYSYLFSLFPIISHLITFTDIRKQERIEIYELLKEIREKIKVLLLQKPGDISKTSRNFELLKTIIDELESLMVAYFYDLTNHYLGNSFDLMKYLLFEIKNYSLIEDILKQYPYLIRLIDKDNKSLIHYLIDYYLEEAKLYTSDKNLNPNTNLVYYDRVLELFLKADKLEFSYKERKDEISKINRYRKMIKNEDYNDLTKRKYIYWLNRILEQLDEKSHDLTFKEVCYMHDIKVGFDEGVLSEARRINNEINPNKYLNREKINDYIITIDGDEAEELDDGLSIKKLDNGLYMLGVHIADPISYIPKDNIILDEGIKRTTSIYLSDPIFMFPEILSKDKMNLLEGKYRLATSFYIYIDDDGKIVDYKFLESIINVHNMTYREVDDILKTGSCSDKELSDTIFLLSGVTSKLDKHFKVDDMYSIINRSESNPSKTNIINSTSSSKMVELCMMLVNYIVPLHMKNNHLPCINRVHTVDQEYLKKLSNIQEKIHSADENEAKSAISYLKTIYPKAKYSTEVLQHFGLGLPIYSHTTSPLRRIADDIMKLYVLDPFYFHLVSDQEAYIIEDKLKSVCDYINERSIIIDSFMECTKNVDKTLKKTYD